MSVHTLPGGTFEEGVECIYADARFPTTHVNVAWQGERRKVTQSCRRPGYEFAMSVHTLPGGTFEKGVECIYADARFPLTWAFNTGFNYRVWGLPDFCN